MAPEQARGETDRLDERADVYGLGGILSAMLKEPEAPIGSIPRPLWSICARAMAESPDDRYSSASALGDDVARYRAGQAVQAHRETSFERAARVAKVYRTPIVLVLTYVIMRALVAFAVRP